MRNKLKKIWNKEDGFTLVELLGVIVILGIILAIAIPAIGNIVSKAKTTTTEQQQELVLDAAQMYYLDGGTEVSVTSQKLKELNYLEQKAPDGITITKAEAESGKLGATTTSSSK